MKPLLTGIYTLTPTHCGTGQASNAIDLPIARESTTGLPILPATSLKGAARAATEATSSSGSPGREHIDNLFGPQLRQSGNETEKMEAEYQAAEKKGNLQAGWLSFGEGQLLVYPFRSLRPALAFATCPLLLERLARALRARRVPSDDPFLKTLSSRNWEQAIRKLKANRTLLGRNTSGPLILEQRLIPTETQEASPVVEALGKALVELLPNNELETRERLQSDLLIVPDDLFLSLVRRCTPVQARVKLTRGKTTSEYKDSQATDSQGTESGNLWYEETLPADCLFWSIIEPRPGGTAKQRRKLQLLFFPEKDASSHPGNGDSEQRSFSDVLRTTQIGGNETVGQGLCLWTMRRPS